MNTFGNRLKELRKNRGLRQDQLAEKLGIAPSTVGAYERDTREPTFELLIKISEYFDVSLDYLLGKEDDSRTVEQALSDNSKELKEFLNSNSVLFNGSELSENDKQRILDILTGMFWDNFKK